MKNLSISLSVTTTSSDDAVRIAETMSRTAIGFGLEGHTVSISISSYEDVEDEDDGPLEP